MADDDQEAVELDQRRSSSKRTRAQSLQTFNEILGDFGPTQLYIFLLIMFSGLMIAWQTSIYIFISTPLKYKCIIRILEPCDQDCPEIIFPGVRPYTSIIVEWNLVCDNAGKGEVTQSILILGFMAGSLLFGHLADHLGRRPCFITACMIMFVMGLITGVTPWYWLFCFSRFFLGLGCGGAVLCCLVFLIENVDVNNRELMVVLFRLPFAFGYSTMPALAYFLPEWRKLQLLSSGLCAVFLAYFWLLEESPRWLLIMGFTEKCVETLQKASRNKNIPREHLRATIKKAHLELKMGAFPSDGTMIDLLRTPNMRKKTCVLCVMWFTLYFKFYGTIEYIAVLAGENLYLNVGLCGWLSIVGTLIAYLILRFVTRRKALLFTYGLSAACLFTVPVLPRSRQYFLSEILAAIVVTLASIAYANLQLFSTELFPTMLRNSGIGLCLFVGRLGSVISPFVVSTRAIQFWLPPVLYAVATTIAGLIILLLPETKGETLPDTIEEGESFGKNVGKNRAGSAGV